MATLEAARTVRAKPTDSVASAYVPRAARPSRVYGFGVERTGRTPAAGNRAWWVIAALALAGAVTSRIIVRQSAIAPRTPWDEISMLQMAKAVAGFDVTPLAGSGYYPGYSFLLAPVWWITTDPRQVYQLSTLVGFAVALLTIWPLTAIARQLGLGVPQAITAAAIVMSLPSRTALEDYVLAEQAFFLFLAVTVAAAFRLWNRPTMLGAVFVAAMAGLSYLMHVRGLVVVLVTGIWLALFLRRRLLPAVVGLVALVASYVAVKAVVAAVTEPMTLWGFSQGGNFLTNIREVWFSLAARVVTAHLWAQLVATFGLIVIGALIVVGWTTAELRRWRAVGPVGFIFGLALAGTILAIVPWLGPAEMLASQPRRFDVWQYTRYIDPYAGLLVLVAVVAIFSVLAARWAKVAIGIAIVGSLVMIFLAAPIIPTWGTNAGPGNAAGVQMWSWIWPRQEFAAPLVPTPVNENRYYIWASVVVVLTLVVVAVLRRRTAVLAVILAGLATTGAIVGNPEHARFYPAKFERSVQQAEAAAGHQLAVDVDTQCNTEDWNKAQALNWTAYWLSPRVVEAVEPDDGDRFGADIVVACIQWERAAQYGAAVMPDSAQYGYAVYVVGGPLQDELRARGELG